ncbi:hypothetical protein [Nocardiopsis sp. CNR-923]|uniref:hypothetical protein n=1 Tax=Nocardiopsis sp. CNR-923 TaxID=1904965 RepID=UPI000AC17611|nr:hypothetical protein [Nocardiopsis sp. CNR-923]
MSFRLRAALSAAVAALTLTACARLDGVQWDSVGDVLHDVATDTVPIVDFDQVDRDDPFGGTDAEDYAEGFDLPDEVSAVGPYSAGRVREAYETVQDLLEAVYLNQDAVFDEDNSEFTSLLTGQALDWYLENHGNEDPRLDTRHIPFNLTPGTADPIGDVVKVNGRMRAEEAVDEYGLDYLAVRTEYTIVHPIARPGDPVSVRLVTSHLARSPSTTRATAPGSSGRSGRAPRAPLTACSTSTPSPPPTPTSGHGASGPRACPRTPTTWRTRVRTWSRRARGNAEPSRRPDRPTRPTRAPRSAGRAGPLPVE